MCGFVALIGPASQVPQAQLERMGEDIAHRGPDSSGTVVERGSAVVFRRLSILDVRAVADQPMRDTTGRYTIVFNGEIYNYRQLRSELEAQGAGFRTTGDTEVLLNGFAAWGPGLLDRIEGMYAFVIVDHEARLAYAARDPYGIKPLYMRRIDGGVAFASEVRPLRRLGPTGPDPAALCELLTFRFAAGRLSNFENIDRIPGGTVVTAGLDDGSVRESRHCDVLDLLAGGEDGGVNPDRSVADGLRQSVKAHLASDVGYALQLSGGVDSSLVAALVREQHPDVPLSTFGINLGDTVHDEKTYRDEVAARFRLDHHEVPISGHDFAEALPRSVRHMEGPTPHLGCVLLMLLCDVIAETNKVVLTGEGADEFFGGYHRYSMWRQFRGYERFANMVPSFAWPFLKRYEALRLYAGRDAAAYASVHHDYRQVIEIFPDLVPGPGAREAASRRFRDFRERLLAVDQTAYLESLLLRQDKMAMAASVESRVPFTHLPLGRRLNGLPLDERVPGEVTKPLLKRLAERYFPREFVHRRKVGLTLPLDDWLADEKGLGRYLEALTEPSARLVAYGNRAGVRKLVEAFRGGDRGKARALTHLINLELWLRDATATPTR